MELYVNFVWETYWKGVFTPGLFRAFVLEVNFSLGIYEHDNHAWICINTIVWDCMRLPEWGGILSIKKLTLEWHTCAEKGF